MVEERLDKVSIVPFSYWNFYEKIMKFLKLDVKLFLSINVDITLHFFFLYVIQFQMIWNFLTLEGQIGGHGNHAF